MAAIPGVRFDISGASGSQGLLSPKSGWFNYVFPRGGYASQDSTGTLITFDSSAIANRFAANDWIQVGTSTDKIRKVSAVGGNSLSVSGAAVTVTKNDRIFLIGNTQPTVTGGSATYTIPRTTIRQRDEDTSDIFTNSMVTTNSDGLVRFYADAGLYDCLIQDGNRANQGLIADLPVGVAEGVSTTFSAVFGATVTFLAGVSMNTTLIVGQSATFSGAVGITGTLTVGQTLTAHAAIGSTGWATFGTSVTIGGALGVTGTGTFGQTLTVSGNAALGASMTITGGISQSGYTGTNTFSGILRSNQEVTTGSHWRVGGGAILISSDFFLGSGWGTSATITPSTFATDVRGNIRIVSAGTGQAANPTFGMTFGNPYSSSSEVTAVIVRGASFSQLTVPVLVNNVSTTHAVFQFQGTPVAGETYSFHYLVMG